MRKSQLAVKVPVVLPKGSTVLDVGASIHKDFVEKLKFARLLALGTTRDWVLAEEQIDPEFLDRLDRWKDRLGPTERRF